MFLNCCFVHRHRRCRTGQDYLGVQVLLQRQINSAPVFASTTLLTVIESLVSFGAVMQMEGRAN
jgi:hypothetical protein